MCGEHIRPTQKNTPLVSHPIHPPLFLCQHISFQILIITTLLHPFIIASVPFWPMLINMFFVVWKCLFFSLVALISTLKPSNSLHLCLRYIFHYNEIQTFGFDPKVLWSVWHWRRSYFKDSNIKFFTRIKISAFFIA